MFSTSEFRLSTAFFCLYTVDFITRDQLFFSYIQVVGKTELRGSKLLFKHQLRLQERKCENAPRTFLFIFWCLEARETTGFMKIYEVVTQSVTASVKIFSSQLLRLVRQVNVR